MGRGLGTLSRSREVKGQPHRSIYRIVLDSAFLFLLEEHMIRELLLSFFEEHQTAVFVETIFFFSNWLHADRS